MEGSTRRPDAGVDEEARWEREESRMTNRENGEKVVETRVARPTRRARRSCKKDRGSRARTTSSWLTDSVMRASAGGRGWRVAQRTAQEGPPAGEVVSRVRHETGQQKLVAGMLGCATTEVEPGGAPNAEIMTYALL